MRLVSQTTHAWQHCNQCNLHVADGSWDTMQDSWLSPNYTLRIPQTPEFVSICLDLSLVYVMRLSCWCS